MEDFEKYRKMIRDSGQKIYPWTLLESALMFCRQALDFPGTWEGKAEVMRQFAEAFPQLWGEFVKDDRQTMAMLNFMVREMALAFRFMSVMSAVADAGEVLSAECRYLHHRMEHYELLELEESGAGKDALSVEMYFLQPFLGRLNEELAKEDASLLFGCAALNSACAALAGKDENGNECENSDTLSRIRRAKGILLGFKPREAYGSTSC